LKAVVQRVKKAQVRVNGRRVSEISKGLLLLLGLEKGDSLEELMKLAERLPKYRFFSDDAGKMNLSLFDINGAMMVVSQFTLAGNLSKGLRPSFDNSMEAGQAKEWISVFVDKVRLSGIEVQEGIFGAYMEVELINDGPVTFVF